MGPSAAPLAGPESTARWQATLDVSRDPAALAADVRVDAGALEVDEPAVRARHGLDGTLSDDDRAQVRSTILGADQLRRALPGDALHHVAARPGRRRGPGAGSDVESGQFRLAGELLVHGRARRIALPVVIAQDGEAFTARGRVRVRQSDFGIRPYSAFMGAVRTQDEVEIAFTLVAVPAAARLADRMATRTESDSLGPIEVPSDAYYGA